MSGAFFYRDTPMKPTWKNAWLLLLAAAAVESAPLFAAAPAAPWSHGRLQASPDGHYLMHADGMPFFWLADTAWLLPERLDRDETVYYLNSCRDAAFNVIQVQTVNGVPAYNRYGASSMPCGYDFTALDEPGGSYGYWEHMDFLVDEAARRGIYVGMVCIWGGLVNAGAMNEAQARAYGTFLGTRYRDRPNIVWIIGGDTRGDVEREVWEALARAIRAADPGHAMTFHPRGRYCSAEWFADAEWLDFHMFQSGHRRYGQRNGDKEYPIPDNTEEDNWRYVERSRALAPRTPVLDGEPSYEAIPLGLHDPTQGLWQAHDVRRYAYWSVFAGACGHTYGHNSVMQFFRPGVVPAYGATIPWHEALQAEGRNQMKHLRRLIEAFPYFERRGDQQLLCGENGERYARVIATRGEDYALVYSCTDAPFTVDLRRLAGRTKRAWWYSPRTGRLYPIGTLRGDKATFRPAEAPIEDFGNGSVGEDWAVIIADAEKEYTKTLE